MINFTKLDSRRQGDMNGALPLSEEDHHRALTPGSLRRP